MTWTSGEYWMTLPKRIITFVAFSKIQLVVYYQCCILIGWAATRLYVIAPSSKKRRVFGDKKGLKSSFN